MTLNDIFYYIWVALIAYLISHQTNFVWFLICNDSFVISLAFKLKTNQFPVVQSIQNIIENTLVISIAKLFADDTYPLQLSIVFTCDAIAIGLCNA